MASTHTQPIATTVHRSISGLCIGTAAAAAATAATEHALAAVMAPTTSARATAADVWFPLGSGNSRTASGAVCPGSGLGRATTATATATATASGGTAPDAGADATVFCPDGRANAGHADAGHAGDATATDGLRAVVAAAAVAVAIAVAVTVPIPVAVAATVLCYSATGVIGGVWNAAGTAAAGQH